MSLVAQRNVLYQVSVAPTVIHFFLLILVIFDDLSDFTELQPTNPLSKAYEQFKHFQSVFRLSEGGEIVFAILITH